MNEEMENEADETIAVNCYYYFDKKYYLEKSIKR